MELAEIRPFEPQMAEIDLFTMPDAVGVGEPSVHKIKPYIAGHITNGDSTFTFKVNNADVTVPVGDNGKWKWVQDQDITSLSEMLYGKTNLDYIEIYLPNNPNLTNLTNSLLYGIGYNGSTYLNLGITANIKCLDTHNVTKFARAFLSWSVSDLRLGDIDFSKGWEFIMTFCYNNKSIKRLDLSKYDFSSATAIQQNFYSTNLEYLHIGSLFASKAQYTNTNAFGSTNDKLTDLDATKITVSVAFTGCSALNEQSVVNLFNAVAADGITLTFHPTVYAMIEAQLEIEGSPIYEAYWNSDYDFNYASA
jgi:hypothetical protein